MKKHKQKWLAALWILAVIGVRVFFYLFTQHTVTDTYGYFKSAMVQAGPRETATFWGLAQVYLYSLSLIFRFTGNNILVVPVYHMILQVIWVILAFAGISMLFGKKVGYVGGSILAFFPCILESAFLVKPDNFYMLCGALLLCLFGFDCFCIKKLRQNKKTEEQVPEGEENREAEMEIEKEMVEIPEEELPGVKKVQFLENPLPVPPKHVAKKMDFDIIEIENDKLEFDQTDVTDDFDI